MTTGRVFGEAFAVVPESVLYADVSPTAKLLWAILQRHADRQGACYPGRKRMAERMRVSEDTVKRAKRELIDAGLLVAQARHDDQGRQTTDLLYLHPRGGKFAPPGGGMDAPPYRDAVELEKEELDPPTPQHARKRRPTDTSPISASPRMPDWTPEPKATAEDRARAARRLREIRQQFTPADCQEFGCHDANGDE